MQNKFKIAVFAAIASLSATSSYANYLHHVSHCTGRTLSTYTLDCSHWYVEGNLGVSHLYDNSNPGIASSVDENGPGWDATLGYQLNSILGAELGYTQYYNSRETLGAFVIAKTTHFAVHLNATARYPIAYKLSALGKLGVAYSYAQKIAEATGVAASSGSVSPYLGLGLDYSLTRTVDMIAQWSFVRGNQYTGSATLYSIGMQFAIT